MFAYIVRRLALMLVTLSGSRSSSSCCCAWSLAISSTSCSTPPLRRSHRQGQSRKGTRPRPADLAAISELDRRAVASRSRLFLCVGKAGVAGDLAAHSDHRTTGGVAFLSPPRSAFRFRRAWRRASPGLAADYALRIVSLERAVAALVLARALDPDGVGLAVRRHADLRSKSETSTRRSRSMPVPAMAVASQRALTMRDHTLLDAGNPAAGPYPHRARQGTSETSVEFSPPR